MTINTTPAVVADPKSMLAGYLDHVATLELSDRSVRDRTRVAEAFLAGHPDLHAWMGLPVAERITELKATRAWSATVSHDRVRQPEAGPRTGCGEEPDGPGQSCRGPRPGRLRRRPSRRTRSRLDIILGRDGARRMLAVLLAHRGGTVAELTSAMVDEFDAALSSSAAIPPSSRRSYRIRVRSMRQLMFQTRVIDTPPIRRRWARSYAQRFADAPMPTRIRDTLLRYVITRSAVLRPKSVESLINDLLPFADYLTSEHRDITSLRDLDRSHIEGFLVWNRTRGWRGQRAAAGVGRSISAAVAQSAVLSLRNLLDDIIAWGWDQAPARRLVFAADVPKLDQPLPRALTPDIDATILNEVARLDDSFARIGLTILRGTGLRVGELLDLKLESVIDYGPAGTWLKVPLGKLATERMVPLSAAALAAGTVTLLNAANWGNMA